MADHKVQINPLTQVVHDEKNFLASLNLNLARLQRAIDDTLSRTGVVPNQMEQVLDMNGKRIINVGKAEDPGDVITKAYIQEIIDEANEAITRLDKLVSDAKTALEVYAAEYIYPAAQHAVDKAEEAAEAAEVAEAAAKSASQTAQQIAVDVEDAKDAAIAAQTAAEAAKVSAENSEQAAQESAQSAAASAQAAADSAASIGTVMRYKGSVATYADLPTTGQTIGDVWNVEEDDSNYAWNGTSWDKLGATFNAENYYTKSQVDAISTALEGDINSLEATVSTIQTDLGDLGDQVVDVQNSRQKNIITSTHTIPSSAWSTATKKVSVPVTGVTSQDTVFVSPDPTSAQIKIWTDSKVFASMAAAGYLELTCEEIPTQSLKINVGVLPK